MREMSLEKYLQDAVEALKSRFSAELTTFRGETTLTLDGEHIVSACLALRDEFGFEMLADQTAVDYWPQTTPRFEVVYQFRSIQHKMVLSLRVSLNGDAPEISTIESVYANANWHEREIWDLFGITFRDHADLRRILMPPDWEGHPLRKDYPLGYEEVQFTFNHEEIDRRKPYAKE